MIGRNISHYRIVDKLGEGGMGSVWKAEDTTLQRLVALKALSVQLAQNEEARARFVREAQAASALNHAHITTVYELLEDEGEQFIAMEYVEGKTIRDIVESGHVSIRKALDIIIQAAEALEAAHNKGILHRDIKSANIMVSMEGNVKVMDFGLAHLEERSQLTRTGTTMGTLAYSSPEQLTGAQVDRRSEVFSLGCVFYELLTGQLPFRSPSEGELVFAIINNEQDRPSKLREDVPETIEAVVTRMLEKESERRHANCNELLQDLRTIHKEMETSTISKETRKAASTEAVLEEQTGIIVLPFVNLSPEPENEYFTDGLTDEIITHLSRLRSLRVISRTSAMLLKNSGKNVKTIGREVDVRYVLEGSVRKAGEQLRVTAQLIDSQTDAHLWAERYDGEIGDVFSIQENIARSIAEALRVELTTEEEEALGSVPVSDVTAYDYVLRARHEIWTGTVKSVEAAMNYLEEAREIVGENIAILSALGEAYFMLAHVTGEGMQDLSERLDDIADRILQLDPLCAAGYFNSALAWLKRHRGFREAVPRFRRATELDPTSSSNLLFHAYYTAELGLTDESLQVSEELVRVDPLSPVVRMCRGWVRLLACDPEQAVYEAERGFVLDPDSAYLRLFLVVPLIQAGLRDKAVRLARDLPKPPRDNWARCIYLYDAALHGRPLDEMLVPEFLETVHGDETFSWILAQCLTQDGRAEEAIDWLENAVSFGFTNSRFLSECDILLAPLHDLPRFKTLMETAAEEVKSLSTGVMSS